MKLPHSKDGHKFDESCRYKDGAFRIGLKGDEIIEADYNKALQILRQLKDPRFRRPSATSDVKGCVKVTGYA